MVNNCHAKRDTKTRSGVAGHFILGYFSVSTRLCPLDSPLPYHLSLPGPYYYWPGNPVEYAVRRSRTPYYRDTAQ
ncbi:hypothetical protein [Candidatus Spongiihabitans sp.]|uniref:hypothetical protein n=1 Tax=Candidatus Spongiihabitans sp. TaxID=3101308 RepID=UPI003C7C8F00